MRESPEQGPVSYSMENRYELLYIIPTSFTDEEVGGVESKISALITKYGATVESTQRLGKLRMAYAINDQRHGHYVMTMFKADALSIAKMEENLRINNDILRHMILRADEAGSDAKFELVQFTEIVVEGGRGDRRREKASENKEAGKEEKAEERSEAKDEASEKKEEASPSEAASA